MNKITATGQYKGDHTTPLGTRSLLLEIPGTGKSPNVPIYLIPTFASRDSCAIGVFEVGANIYFEGRLYLGNDFKMYVIPTREVASAPPNLRINDLALAGGTSQTTYKAGVGVINFAIICQAPPQKILDLTDDKKDPGFRVEAWGDDAKRLEKNLWKGRGVALGAALKYEQWEKDGVMNSRYKVRVKSNQYSFFGKRPATEQKDPPIASFDKPEIFESPHQQAISKPNNEINKPPVDDGIPF